MLFLILFSFIIGFLSNFVITIFCKNYINLKNLLYTSILKNKFLSFSIIAINIILYILLYYNYNLSIYFFIYGIVFTFLVCLSIIDIKIGIVPDSINILIFILSVIFILKTKSNATYHIIGFFIISTPFFLISIFTNGIGGGDVKLFAVTGLLLGAFHIFLAMFICCFIASIVGISLKYFNKNYAKSDKTYIPLVPYICIGVIISTLYGNFILQWYFSKFLY